MELVKYEAARFALSQAIQFDEVMAIKDTAERAMLYARQAQDTELIEKAAEIRVRAERRAGEMLKTMPKQNGARTGSYDTTPFRLADIGITKDQSHRWQRLAAVPEDQFEQAIQAAKEVAGEITTAAMLRVEKANRPPVEKKEVVEEIPPQENHDHDDQKEALLYLAEENQKLKDQIATGILPEGEQKTAAETIKSLRDEVKTLKITLSAVTRSRDEAMREVAQLKQQCQMQQREIKKLKA